MCQHTSGIRTSDLAVSSIYISEAMEANIDEGKDGQSG